MMVECSCLSEDAPMVMQYTNYEALVCKLGIELVGWTEPKICNPGKRMTALSLNRLLNALRQGDCHWVKLTQVTLTDEIDAQDAKMLAGRGQLAVTRAPPRSIRGVTGMVMGSTRAQRMCQILWMMMVD